MAQFTQNDIKDIILETSDEHLIQMVLSNPVDREQVSKIKIRPVIIKDKLLFQMSSFVGTKVLHDNLEKDALADTICAMLPSKFLQMEIDGKTIRVTVLLNKKGTITIKKKNKTVSDNLKINQSLKHNREKQYILSENEKIPFLVDLGVQSAEGKLIHAKYDKFRQINRYLEFIRDIIPALPQERELTIIDFGCGKSYLTFAMYFYLHNMLGMNIKVIGLDLKEDVIKKCNELKDKYGYDGLSFQMGDISRFEGVDKVDMVVTLHACDTATDYALYKAVKWGAQVILSVPCCQHEMNAKMKNDELTPMIKYGIIRERFAALATDAIRANILEQCGYTTQILEFIDMEHTPKNILIRAVKNDKSKMMSSAGIKKNNAFMDFLNVEPTLARLIKEL